MRHQVLLREDAETGLVADRRADAETREEGDGRADAQTGYGDPRARFRDALREQHPEIFTGIKSKVWKQNQWVVHAKAVGSGEQTLAYLARYVYRVALSERAILHHEPNRITVRYRKSGTNEPRTMRLEPAEFIRRFLQHVLPPGFRKIRYFGLHHSSKRHVLRSLQAAMAIRLGIPMPEPPPIVEPARPPCPDCQTPMHFEARSPRGGVLPSSIRTRGPP